MPSQTKKKIKKKTKKKTRKAARNGAGTQLPVPRFLSDGLESGRKGLTTLQDRTQSVLADLRDRGTEEFDALRDRLGVDEVADRAREVQDRVTDLALDLEARFRDLQGRALGLVGIASRNDLEGLHADLRKLSRKLDRLAGPTGKKAKKRAHKPRAATARA